MDFIFLEVNEAFEKLTGLADVVGKRVTEVIPGIQNDPADWIGVYGRVATTGNSAQFESYSEKLGKWYAVTAYCTSPGRFAAVFEDISQLKAAEGELRRQREWLLTSEARFKLLSDTSGLLLATENPQGIVNELCRAVMEHLNCQAFFNFLVDETCGRLHLNACAGIPPEEVRKIQWLDYGVAVCGCVARDQQRIIAEDILNSTDPRTELVESYGIQAYCCHPLMVQGQMIGTLSFGTKVRPKFKTEDIELMRTVTDQVALAMQRIQTQQALRNANEILEDNVRERTAALARTVETLEGEIKLRQQAENELRLANQKLAERADQLRKLTGQLTMAEQRERMRLSKILHDGLQQYLAIAKLHLSSVSYQTDNDDLKQSASEVEAMISESIQISRLLSTELSPPVLYEGGLAAGLEWLARWMREKHAFHVDLSMDANADLPEDVKVLVFESVRELLFNAVKHAAVSRAEIHLQQVDGTGVRISVKDEGAGFDIHHLKPMGGYGECFGLFSIRERLGLIGGHFEIDSMPGKGSCFTLTLPYGLKPQKTTRSDPQPVPSSLDHSAPGTLHQTPAIRVLIADDHSLFRDGVARLVSREADISVIGQACDGQEAIDLTLQLMPDVILMDINMPGVNGIEATRRIHQELPQIQIIGLSMHEAPDHAQAMRAAGAVGYQNKGCGAAELVFAIRACVGSECWLKPKGTRKNNFRVCR